MSKHFKVIQSQYEVDVQTQLIKKLYNLVCKQELTEDEYDNLTNLIGNIQLSSPSYRQWVDKIQEHFPQILITGDYYILFQDPTLESIMATYLLSKGVGDGNGITEDNAKDKKITSLPSFEGNTNIEYFNELPFFERVSSLQDRCFKNCTNLKEIDLSNITTLNYDSHFYTCTNLTKVTLGNLNYTSSSCFNGCSSLETIENSENLVTIGGSSFRNCISLESIDLSNCRTIGDWAFAGCKILHTINIDNVETIDLNAFNNCSALNLENSTLENCVSIGNSAFINTPIEEIILPVCISLGISAFESCKSLTTASIPKVTSIPANVFWNCSQLSSLTISPNVVSIGSLAFRGCAKLRFDNITLENCASIGMQGFLGCKLLTEISLPACTTLGESVFSDCSALTTVSMPLITSLPRSVFEKCILLQNINVPNVTSVNKDAFYQCKALKNIDLPNCTSIGETAFFQCYSLTSVTTNCTNIGQAAFQNCTSLTTISNLSDILLVNTTHGLFGECKSLNFPTNATINSSYVGHLTFTNCNLINITLGTNVKSLYNRAFESCKSLTTINGLENITHIGSWAFHGCALLQGTINLSNLEGYVTGRIFQNDQGGSIGLFNRCAKIKKIILGYLPSIILSAFTADNTPFRMCTELHTVDITTLDSITSTRNPLFSECPAMRNFVLRCAPPTISIVPEDVTRTMMQRIIGSTTSSLKIYVPDEYLNDYKTAEHWSDLSSNIYPLSEYVEIQD